MLRLSIFNIHLKALLFRINTVQTVSMCIEIFYLNMIINIVNHQLLILILFPLQCFCFQRLTMMRIYLATPQQCLHQIQVLFIEFFHFSVIVSFPFLSFFFNRGLCNNSMVVLYSSLVYHYCCIRNAKLTNEDVYATCGKGSRGFKMFQPKLYITYLHDKKIYSKLPHIVSFCLLQVYI